jgi:hypothetical protein
MRTISLPHRSKLQTRAITGIYMLHYGVGPDLSLLNLKLKLCLYQSDAWTSSLSKEPTWAQIPNLRNSNRETGGSLTSLLVD